MLKDQKFQTVLNAKGADGIGTPMYIGDHQHVILEIWFAAATLTIKFQGSVSESVPDFSAAQALDNLWDYIEVVDLEDGTAIDGDTGISSSGAASDARIVELNTNGMRWLNLIVSSRSAGSVTVKARSFNNQ